jgi:ubiquitin fusion degradation protein 1
MLEGEAKVPGALNLPFGQLFFGFNVVPHTPQGAPLSPTPAVQEPSFGGSGNTLSGRSAPSASSTSGKGKEKEKAPESENKASSWGGGGQTLGSRAPASAPNTFVPGSFRADVSPGSFGAGGAQAPRLPQRGPPKPKAKERSPSPDWGVDDDDDAIVIDSD